MDFDFEVENRMRIVRLEQQVQFLLTQLGMVEQEQEAANNATDSGEIDLTEVRELIRRGNKIGAIKVYREKTGVGLREAKEAVERMIGW